MFYLLCTPYSLTILRSKKPHHKVVLLLTDLPATYSVLPTPYLLGTPYSLPTRYPLPTTYYSTYSVTILRSKMASSCRRPAMITAATCHIRESDESAKHTRYPWLGFGFGSGPPTMNTLTTHS